MHPEPSRIRFLNQREVRAGRYVLYWMQQSQRAEHNPALDYAVREANRLSLPILVGFGLTDRYPEANLRHYRFMLEGLQETAAALARKGIPLILRLGAPPEVALSLGAPAALIVCDWGYLRHQRGWRQAVATAAACRVAAVEGDAVVPVDEVSTKAEYAARTIRPRIQRRVADYLVLPRAPRLAHAATADIARGERLDDIDRLLARLAIDRGVAPVTAFFRGGTREAKRRLNAFLRTGLARYHDHRNQPQTDDISHMSPYLHFGQISPLYLACRVRDATQGQGIDRAAYLEELIVRRELALNFVTHNPDYDRYAGLPSWARRTLAEHAGDRRPHLYSSQSLEQAATHDPYWNAAMREMKSTGFMHNYMRMYWGKKILEWSAAPETAFATTLRLNNKYFLDGRDANSYAGVAWIFGRHDRAWFERPVFGKVRYMAAGGLERKCDIQAYLRKVDGLERRAAV